MIFAVSGKLASGKDTAANIICEYLDQNQTLLFTPIFKFADWVYSLAASYDDVDIWDENGWEVDPQTKITTTLIDIRTREFLEGLVQAGILRREEAGQHLQPLSDIAKSTPTTSGVKNRDRLRSLAEYVRGNIDPEAWIKLTAEDIAAAGRSSFTSAVISDLRTSYELAWCNQSGVKTIRIDVSPKVQAQRLRASGLEPDPIAINHITETELDSYDGFDLRISNDGDTETLRTLLGSFLQGINSQVQTAER
jgi:head-tail adaptor